MEETTGLKLIEQLKNSTVESWDGERSYQLLQAYYKGFPVGTLRELFYCEDERIRQVAIWIASELGKKARCLLKEVTAQMDDSNPHIQCFALELVAHIADGEYFDDFIRVFAFLEHPNQKTRLLVMHILTGVSDPRLQEAFAYLENRDTYTDSHKKGLLALVNSNSLAPAELAQMMNSGDDITRKYGIIAAVRSYNKQRRTVRFYERHLLEYPQLVKDAMDAQDLDVKEFAKAVVESRSGTVAQRKQNEPGQ